MATLPKGNISIDDLSLAHLDYSRHWVPGTPFKPTPIELDFDVRTTNANPRSAIVSATMDVWRNSPEVPFRISLTYELRASVETDEEVPLLHAFTKSNAVAVLWPYIREALSNVTTRSGFPPLVLPPVNVERLLELVNAKSARAAADKPPAAE